MADAGEMPEREAGFDSAVACERAFYAAFAGQDVAAMAAVWADEEVCCIHPGGGVLRTRELVLASWAAIFEDALAPRIRVHILSRASADGLAVHVVQEQISRGEHTSHVLATNVFRRAGTGWRMIAHHGSVPATRQEAAPAGRSLH